MKWRKFRECLNVDWSFRRPSLGVSWPSICFFPSLLYARIASITWRQASKIHKWGLKYTWLTLNGGIKRPTFRHYCLLHTLTITTATIKEPKYCIQMVNNSLFPSEYPSTLSHARGVMLCNIKFRSVCGCLSLMVTKGVIYQSVRETVCCSDDSPFNSFRCEL